MRSRLFPQGGRRTSGVTILEVLFSMLIGTIGLLGAIALLPVASEQARKGRQADAQAIAGEAFVNEFKSRRWYDPDMWVAHDGTQFILHDSDQHQWRSASGSTTTGPNLGDSFCVDPRGTSLYTNGLVNYRQFPYDPASSMPGVKMHRVGLAADRTPATTGSSLNGKLYFPTVSALSDLLCSSADDLLVDRAAKDKALPARQMFNPLDPTIAAKLHRDSENNLSWIATLCPTTGNVGEEYVLSVVVFHKRLLPAATPDPGAEREITQVAFSGGGISGGEVTLGATSADRLTLQTGDWLMLKGQANGAAYFRWYRVLETEIEPQGSAGSFTREVTLFGPDWPQVFTGASPPPTQAVLFNGVAAVYEKTIRIQHSSLWQ